MTQTYKNSYTARERELVSLAVYSTGYQKCLPSHQWGPGIRDHFLLHHVISGKGYYTSRNTTYALEAGDTFLIYPFEEITYTADPSNPWEYAWVGFVGTDAKTIMKASGFTPDHPIIYQSLNSDYVKRQLIHIYEARGSELYNAVEMTGRLYTTLSGFLHKEGSLCITPKTSYDNYAQSAIEFIHNNYSYPITVLDIAEYVGISRSHLFRAFQETMDCSPKEYLTSFRINQACMLLLHSDLSITVIGRSVGFEDSLNFSKAFKKATGYAPSKYQGEDSL